MLRDAISKNLRGCGSSFFFIFFFRLRNELDWRLPLAGCSPYLELGIPNCLIRTGSIPFPIAVGDFAYACDELAVTRGLTLLTFLLLLFLCCYFLFP